MEVKAKQRNIRMPARKVRRVINTIRGKSVQDAAKILKFMPYFAARVVEKNLQCAVANASEKWGALAEELIVSEIYADEGPTFKRARPRAQGRVYRIHKGNTHLTIKVKISEELKEKLKEKKKKTKKTKAKKAETKAEKSVEEAKKTETPEQITETKTQPEVESTVENESEKVEAEKNISAETEQAEISAETAEETPEKEETEKSSEDNTNKEEENKE